MELLTSLWVESDEGLQARHDHEEELAEAEREREREARERDAADAADAAGADKGVEAGADSSPDGAPAAASASAFGGRTRRVRCALSNQSLIRVDADMDAGTSESKRVDGLTCIRIHVRNKRSPTGFLLSLSISISLSLSLAVARLQLKLNR